MSHKLTNATVVVALLCLLGSRQMRAAEIGSVDAALESEITLNLADVTLDSALQAISGEGNISIVPDRRELTRAGVHLDQISVTLRAAGIKLRKALESILDARDLAWIERHGVVMITSTQAANEIYFETRVYKVTRAVPVDRRTRSITSNVARQSWVIVGGKGDATPLPPKYIVILQSPAIHRQVAETFRHSVVRVKETQRSELDASPSIRKLNALGKVDFDAVLLTAAFKHLAQQHDLAIEIDQAAISELGVQADKRVVSLGIRYPIRLESILSLLLESVHDELEWVVNDQTIRITTKTAAAKTLTDATYDLQEMLKSMDGKYLVEAIEYNIAADTWEFGGGDGSIELTENGKLKVHQSDPVHRELRQFLADLRIAQQGEE